MKKHCIYVYVLVLVASLLSACVNPVESKQTWFPPTSKGPYTFSTISDASRKPAYMVTVNQLVYRIPNSPARPPFPTIIIEPGLSSSTSSLNDVCDRYASFGFLVIVLTNKEQLNPFITNLEPYKNAMLEVLQFTVLRNTIDTCRLFGLVDTAKIGVSGHSMGGGGTIMACDSISHPYNRYIKVSLAMNPFGNCLGPNIQIPILLFSSETDATISLVMLNVGSSPTDIYASYKSFTKASSKLFANFKDMEHNGVVDENLFLATSGNANVFLPTMVSWFKSKLVGDTLYNKYLDTTSVEFNNLKSRFVAASNVPAYEYMK